MKRCLTCKESFAYTDDAKRHAVKTGHLEFIHGDFLTFTEDDLTPFQDNESKANGSTT